MGLGFGGLGVSGFRGLGLGVWGFGLSGPWEAGEDQRCGKARTWARPMSFEAQESDAPNSEALTPLKSKILKTPRQPLKSLNPKP